MPLHAAAAERARAAARQPGGRAGHAGRGARRRDPVEQPARALRHQRLAGARLRAPRCERLGAAGRGAPQAAGGGSCPSRWPASTRSVEVVYEGTAGEFGADAQLDAHPGAPRAGRLRPRQALRLAPARRAARELTRVLLVTDGVRHRRRDRAAESSAGRRRRCGRAGVERLDVVVVGGIRDDGAARAALGQRRPRARRRGARRRAARGAASPQRARRPRDLGHQGRGAGGAAGCGRARSTACSPATRCWSTPTSRRASRFEVELGGAAVGDAARGDRVRGRAAAARARLGQRRDPAPDGQRGRRGPDRGPAEALKKRIIELSTQVPRALATSPRCWCWRPRRTTRASASTGARWPTSSPSARPGSSCSTAPRRDAPGRRRAPRPESAARRRADERCQGAAARRSARPAEMLKKRQASPQEPARRRCDRRRRRTPAPPRRPDAPAAAPPREPPPPPPPPRRAERVEPRLGRAPAPARARRRRRRAPRRAGADRGAARASSRSTRARRRPSGAPRRCARADPPPRPAPPPTPASTSVPGPTAWSAAGATAAATAGGGSPSADAAAAPYTGKLAEVMDLLATASAKEALDARARAGAKREPGRRAGARRARRGARGARRRTRGRRAPTARSSICSRRAPTCAASPASASSASARAAGAATLAVDTYRARRVPQRPDHPASHRLLAFALLRDGRLAEAFDAIVAGAAPQLPGGPLRRRRPASCARTSASIAAAWITAQPARAGRDPRAARARGRRRCRRGPSLRFVLNWETDANDVDFHIHDGQRRPRLLLADARSPRAASSTPTSPPATARSASPSEGRRARLPVHAAGPLLLARPDGLRHGQAARSSSTTARAACASRSARSWS